MLKRLLCMSTAALLMVNAPMAAAAMEGTSTYVSVTGYDANVDYTAQIYECLKDGSPYAIEVPLFAGCTADRKTGLTK